MKRKKSLFFCLFLAVALFLTACSSNGKKESSAPIRIIGLKGPTSMGMVKLMADAKENPKALPLSFELVTSPDQAVPKILKGEADVAALPANLGAVLYQKSKGEIVNLNINTLGVLYIVEKGDSIQSIKDLKGKTLYASGKGASPEYILRYLLKENGIPPEEVHVDWKNEHAEALAALSEDPKALALLPQPFVTIAQTKVKDLRIALDLTKEWDKTQEKEEKPSALVMGTLLCRKEFVLAHPEEIKALLKAYEGSVTYVNENKKEAAQLIEEFGIFPAPIAEKSLPYCNLVSITGPAMKERLCGYLEVLFRENPKSVGGKLPGEDFYYLP